MPPGREQVSWLSSSTPPTCSCDKLLPRSFAESPRQTWFVRVSGDAILQRRTARRSHTDRPPSALAAFVVRYDSTRPALPSARLCRSRTSIRSRPRDALFTPAIRTPRGAHEARPTRDHRRWRRYGPPTSTAYIRARRRRHDRPRVKGGPTSHPPEPESSSPSPRRPAARQSSASSSRSTPPLIVFQPFVFVAQA